MEASEPNPTLSASARMRAWRRAAARFRGPAPLPRLWFFTDPARTPDPLAVARALPEGAAVVYRHFGAANRRHAARQLRLLCSARGLRLLIGLDAELAAAVQADGVHLPERAAHEIAVLRAAHPHWLVTVAAHSEAALQRAACADAAILSPVFPSRSPSAGAALSLPRAARLIRTVPLPVIGLGGVTLARTHDLARAGFAGAAGIDLFVE